MRYKDFIKKVKKNKVTKLYELSFIRYPACIVVVNNEKNKAEFFNSVEEACHTYRRIIQRSFDNAMTGKGKTRLIFHGRGEGFYCE